jgi:hypothetical protein
MNGDRQQQKPERAEGGPEVTGGKSSANLPKATGGKSSANLPKAEGAQTSSAVRKALDNNLVGVQQFDMTEEEVKIWDTKVGTVVGLLLLVGGGSALLFAIIKLINWLNS